MPFMAEQMLDEMKQNSPNHPLYVAPNGPWACESYFEYQMIIFAPQLYSNEWDGINYGGFDDKRWGLRLDQRKGVGIEGPGVQQVHLDDRPVLHSCSYVTGEPSSAALNQFKYRFRVEGPVSGDMIPLEPCYWAWRMSFWYCQLLNSRISLILVNIGSILFGSFLAIFRHPFLAKIIVVMPILTLYWCAPKKCPFFTERIFKSNGAFLKQPKVQRKGSWKLEWNGDVDSGKEGAVQWYSTV